VKPFRDEGFKLLRKIVLLLATVACIVAAILNLAFPGIFEPIISSIEQLQGGKTVNLTLEATLTARIVLILRTAGIVVFALTYDTR
jgi:ABC-type metal ion transport system substrate-binding protein